MKSLLVLLLMLSLFSMSCSQQQRADAPALSVAQPSQNVAAEPVHAESRTAEPQKVSLTDVDNAETTNEAFERKIIRNAAITMEVDSTTDAQHRITSIAGSHGGFVVTSEAKQRENIEPSKRTIDIKLVARIPADRFGVALDQIKQLAAN